MMTRVWLRTASMVSLLMSRLVLGFMFGLLLMGATAVTAAPTTVTFGFSWSSGSFMQGFQSVVNQFNQANPDVQIEIVPGMNTEKYLVAVAGGAAPDIYSIGDGEIRDAILNGLALNISDLLQKEGVRSTDFIPPAWQRVVWMGKVWGLPYTADPNFALFSNTQHLNETGLVPPTTIDELNQANMKLTKYTSAGALARIGINPWDGVGGYVNAYMTWAWAFGGSFYDDRTEKITPAHPQNVAAMEWFKESTLRIPYADVIAAFPGSVLNRFANGNVTMFPSNPPQVNNLRNMNKSLEISVTVLPHMPNVGNPMWIGGHTLFISRDSKKREAAFRFLQFACATPEGTQALLAPSGFFPAYRRSGIYDKYNQDALLRPFIQLQQSARLTRADIPNATIYLNALTNATKAVVESGGIPNNVLQEVERLAQPGVTERLQKAKTR